MQHRVSVSLAWSCLVVIGTCLCAHAQIPNAGFENWTDGEPDNWVTSNSAPAFWNVTASDTAHGGSKAVLGSVVDIGGIGVPVTIAVGDNGAGFPYTGHPAAMHGWYQFKAVGGDIFIIHTGFEEGGNAIGAGSFQTNQSMPTFAEFVANIVWNSQDAPDNAIIAAQIIGTNGLPTPGSAFLLDDLSYSATTEAAALSALPAKPSIEAVAPNPVRGSSVVTFALSHGTPATVSVVDMLGREVTVLVDGYFEPGRYRTTFVAGSLPSGPYLTILRTPTVTAVRLMRVTK